MRHDGEGVGVVQQVLDQPQQRLGVDVVLQAESSIVMGTSNIMMLFIVMGTSNIMVEDGIMIRTSGSRMIAVARQGR